MDKFIFLDHTADIMFDAFGFSVEEAFENAAGALFTVTCHLDRLKGSSREVKVVEQADSLEELFAFALNDLVGESDSQELFFREFKVGKLRQENDAWRLEGVATGFDFTPEAGNTHVKSVTHHGTQVVQEGGRWRARILLDI